MLRFGRISAIYAAEARYEVTFDDDNLVSGKLAAMVPNTKLNKDEAPFAKDEHVACLMDGNCERGVILGAIYDAKNAPPVGSDTKRSTTFKDGSFLKVDHESGEVEAQFAKVTLNGGENGGVPKSEPIKEVDDAVIDAINALKQIISSWVPVANDGGAALKTAASTWAGTQLTKKTKTGYENDKILH